MSLRSTTLPLVLCLALAGCAGPQKRYLSEADAAEYNNTPECRGEVECQRMWRRAQAWVATYGDMKIQTISDAIIETYNPKSYDPKWHFRVLRVPSGTGADRIELTATCAGFCQKSPAQRVAEFNRYIRQAL